MTSDPELSKTGDTYYTTEVHLPALNSQSLTNTRVSALKGKGLEGRKEIGHIVQ